MKRGLVFETDSSDSESFVPYSAREGGLYPIDGGMMAGVKANCSIIGSRLYGFLRDSKYQKRNFRPE